MWFFFIMTHQVHLQSVIPLEALVTYFADVWPLLIYMGFNMIHVFIHGRELGIAELASEFIEVSVNSLMFC